MEGTGNLLGDVGRGITSVEVGLGEVSGVGVEVIESTTVMKLEKIKNRGHIYKGRNIMYGI